MSLIQRMKHSSSSLSSGALDGKRILALFLVIFMSILLVTSLGVMIIFNSGSSGNDTGIDDDTGNGDLIVEVQTFPDTFRSGMTEVVTGRVVDDEGGPIDDTSISIDFSDLEGETYRTRSRSDGTFTLDFWTPLLMEEGDHQIEINAYKQGYTRDIKTYSVPIIVPETWTFMIYMSDCDLEAWALSDINELETIQESPFLNIVVQLDRWESLSPKDDTSNGNWTSAKRIEIGYDEDPLVLGSRELEDIGEIDSADPEELADFISFSRENYPSDRSALVLWNHGSGIDGICWEQSTEEDQVISINELESALDMATDGGSDPIDLIGFDACLMSTIEVAYQIAPYGSRLLASEITEPNFGWDYSVLGSLTSDPFMDIDEISSELIDGYIEQGDTISSRRSMSLSLTNLSKIDKVVDDIDSLSNTVNSAGPSEIYNMRIARKYAQPISGGTSSEAVDLYDYITNVMDLSTNSMVISDCERLLASIDDSVILFDARQGLSDLETDGLNGLSIFSPDFSEVFSSKEEYDDLKFSQDTSWSDTLIAMYENMEADMEERIVSFDVELFSCRISDEDGDCLPDTMRFDFTIDSWSSEIEDIFLGVNVYNLRGMYIDSTWSTMEIGSNSTKKISITFYPEGEDAESGMYRIAAYLCLGVTFDPLTLQDYVRSGYRWLEVYAE